MFKNILFATSLCLSSTVFASQLQCQFSENIKNQQAQNNISAEINSQGEAEIKLNSSLIKNAVVKVQKNQFILSYTDYETNQVTVMSAGGFEGDDVRFTQTFQRPEMNSFNLDCVRGEKNYQPIDVQSVNCKLIESAGAHNYEINFTSNLASGGHDITPLPPARLNSVNGWVLPFSGLIGIHMRDLINYKGRWIAIFAPLGHPAQATWIANKNTAIRSTVICQPAK